MKEVVEKHTDVATIDAAAFGQHQVKADNVVIPKVLVMQGLSKLVTEGKAKFGDFVDSLSGDTIGNIETAPVEFIPFKWWETWIVSKKFGNRYHFDHVEDVTPANNNKKWEEVVDGEEYKNERAFNFYALLVNDPTIPYLLQFKSTSLKAGKELYTQMFLKNPASGGHVASKVMALSGSRVEKDGNTFAVLKTGVVRDSEKGEIAGALEWFQTVNKGGATAHDDQF